MTSPEDILNLADQYDDYCQKHEKGLDANISQKKNQSI